MNVLLFGHDTPILADGSVSISDLKKNPSAVIAAAEGFPVAVINRNTPAAYLVPAKAWEALGGYGAGGHRAGTGT